MKYFILIVGIVLVMTSCNPSNILDKKKLTKKYFIGKYTCDNFDEFKINVDIRDSIYYCSYVNNGRLNIDSGKWYFFNNKYTSIILSEFPFELSESENDIRLNKSNISFDVDCNGVDYLGDLIIGFAGGEQEFRLIKTDKKRNINYFQKK